MNKWTDDDSNVLSLAMGRGPITRRSFPREAFPREDAQGYVSARETLRAETLRAEKIGALSDPDLYSDVSVVQSRPVISS